MGRANQALNFLGRIAGGFLLLLFMGVFSALLNKLNKPYIIFQLSVFFSLLSPIFQ